MSNKTLKELYGDFWKEFQKFITEVSFGILCLFPILLFFAYLFVLGEEVPATLDCILAVVFNLVYVPLPAWLWVHRHYSYTVPEYVLAVLKFYFLHMSTTHGDAVRSILGVIFTNLVIYIDDIFIRLFKDYRCNSYSERNCT